MTVIKCQPKSKKIYLQIRLMKSQKRSQPQQKQQKKIKDPRMVAAGKKLAEKNKIAREALKKQREEEEKEKDSSSWLPNTSFTTILSVVGIGLTIFNLYLRTRQTKVQVRRMKFQKLKIKLKHKVRHKEKYLEWSK